MKDFPKTPNLAKAVIELVKTVGPIAKNMEIGTGKNSYKGVADKDVKEKVGQALAANGLCLLPIEVNANESTFISKGYNGEDKTNFFTSVVTKYLLLHESGESVELTGYGHGVDTQDKAAGKATTYALKYLLLYLSMAATGGIDDSDGTHSDALPPRTVAPPPPASLKPTAQQSVNSFEAQAKASASSPATAGKSAPATTVAPATSESPSGKHKLVKDDEKWGRVIEWANLNRGKGVDFILEKLKVNNEISPAVADQIKAELNL